MFGLDNKSGINVMPTIAPADSQTPLWFTEGGAGLSATYPGQDWFNQIQAELLNVLKAADIAPQKGDLSQLSSAISKLASAYALSVVHTTGQSQTSVMSQYGATKAFQPIGKYQPQGNYADKDATVKQRFSDAIQCRYGIEIADSEGGIATGLYSAGGKITLTSGGGVIELRNKSGIMALTNEVITALRLSTPRVVDSRIGDWMDFSTSEIVVGMLMTQTPGGGPWVVSQLRVARLQAFINGAWVNVTQ